MSLLRATISDARSPIIGGLGQIVPRVGVDFTIQPFGLNPVWGGRAIVFADDGNSGTAPHPNFMGGFSDDPGVYVAQSAGSGRQTFGGIVKVNPDLSVAWEYKVPGITDLNRITQCNGEDEPVFITDDVDTIYATFYCDWDYDGAVTPISVATTSTNAATTSHTVNIPGGLAAGDLVIACGTFSSPVTVTRPTDWVTEREDAISSVGDSGIYVYRATGAEGGSVTFTTNISVDTVWHSFTTPAGDWLDTGTLTDALSYGTSHDGTGTAPNPGSIPQGTIKWGDYTFVTLCFVDAVETFSAYPTLTTGGTYTQGASVTIASAFSKDQTREASWNPDAFTKSASGNFVSLGFIINPPTSKGHGFLEDELVGGCVAVKRDGTLKWAALNSNISTSGASVAASPDGSTVLCRIGQAWLGPGGGSTSESIAILDGSDGSIISVHNPSNVVNGSTTKMTVFGANNDKVLFYATGTSASLKTLHARSLDDIEGPDLWTLDKTTDFSAICSTVDAMIRRPDGGLLFADGDNNEEWLVLISEDGVVEKEIDLTLLHGAAGVTTRLRGVHYDIAGQIYAHVDGTTGSDVLRLDADLNVIWSLVDEGFTQGTAGGTGLAADWPLMSNAMEVWIGSDGDLYLAEFSVSGIDDGYVAVFHQT
jgi:hypothetical protein